MSIGYDNNVPASAFSRIAGERELNPEWERRIDLLADGEEAGYDKDGDATPVAIENVKAWLRERDPNLGDLGIQIHRTFDGGYMVAFDELGLRLAVCFEGGGSTNIFGYVLDPEPRP
ncbi:MAG: hypothetical protein B7Z40_08575 [Bosea sp. 12-68-7]|nr:MAG: hypothetical protein B7Z40_08575 [Bosea sp. 12-68-7]